MDSTHIPWVADQVLARRHWGLAPDKVLVLSIVRFPGLAWDPETRSVRASYDAIKQKYESSGSGYAMLASALPSEGFWMDPAANDRQYLSSSVLHTLGQAGVEYLYSSRLSDYAQLSSASPTLDTAFLGPALYAMDELGAGVAAEVVQGGSEGVLRRQGTLAMSRAVASAEGGGESGAGGGKRSSQSSSSPAAFGEKSPFSCLIGAPDLESALGRALVGLAAKQPGGIWAGNSRYLFKLKALRHLVRGPTSFKWNVKAQAPCAYLSMDIVDLTSHPEIK